MLIKYTRFIRNGNLDIHERLMDSLVIVIDFDLNYSYDFSFHVMFFIDLPLLYRYA